jgi:hypothetical protein
LEKQRQTSSNADAHFDAKENVSGIEIEIDCWLYAAK